MKENIYQLTVTTEDFQYYTEDNQGFCISCGEFAYGVEPDARGYKCECCDKPSVYGFEELLLMGHIQIDDSEEE